VFGLDLGYDGNGNEIPGNNNMNGTLPETLASWTDLRVSLEKSRPILLDVVLEIQRPLAHFCNCL